MKKIRIAIVGLVWGDHLIEYDLIDGPATPYFNLAAVCDIDKEKADRVAKKYGVKPYYTLDDLLEDDSIVAIGLMTGPDNRASLLRKIIRAGKDVITTKPFERDAKAALDILHEVKHVGRVIHLNSPSPTLSQDMQQIKKWQEEYRLGMAVACRAQDWASYREKPDGSWYDDPDICPVAPIFRIGIYSITDILALFKQPDKIQVMSSRVFTQRPTPDNAQVNILFKNGAIASIFASFCVGDTEYWKNDLILNFEKGTIYRNAGPVSGRAPFHHSELTLVVGRGKQKEIHRTTIDDYSGKYQWDVFYQAMNGINIENEITPEEIVKGIEVINAMRRAELSGKTEAI